LFSLQENITNQNDCESDKKQSVQPGSQMKRLLLSFDGYQEFSDYALL